jgi:hypothetical protein
MTRCGYVLRSALVPLSLGAPARPQDQNPITIGGPHRCFSGHVLGRPIKGISGDSQQKADVAGAMVRPRWCRTDR